MEIILAIATIIGGIAAIHFYYDKLPNESLPKFLRKKAPKFFAMAKCSYSDVADNNLALKENIKYALSEIQNIEFQALLRGHCGGEFCIDFVVELSGSKVYGILAAYDDSEWVSKNTVSKTLKNIKNAIPCDDFCSFLIVTNSQIKQKDKNKFVFENVEIDFNEGECTPESLYISLKTFHEKNIFKINAQQRGQSDCGNGSGADAAS